MAKRPQPLFLARASYRQRRLRDAARLLPLLGALLWLIPLFWERGPDGVGTSTVLLYVFGVWMLLILAALALSRLIAPDSDDPGAEDAP